MSQQDRQAGQAEAAGQTARRRLCKVDGCSGAGQAAATVYRVRQAGGGRIWQCQPCADALAAGSREAAAAVVAAGMAAEAAADAAEAADKAARRTLPRGKTGRQCGACGEYGASVRGTYWRSRAASPADLSAAAAEAAPDKAAAAEDKRRRRGNRARVDGWLCPGCADVARLAGEAERLAEAAEAAAALAADPAAAVAAAEAAEAERERLAAWLAAGQESAEAFRREAEREAWERLAALEYRRDAAVWHAARAERLAEAAVTACHAAAEAAGAGSPAAVRAAVAAATEAADAAGMYGADALAGMRADALAARQPGRRAGAVAVALRLAEAAREAARAEAARAADASPLAVIERQCGADGDAAARATEAVVRAAVRACLRHYPARPAETLAADRIEWRDAGGVRRGPSGQWLPVREAGAVGLAAVARSAAASAARHGAAGGTAPGRAVVIRVPDAAAWEAWAGTLGAGPARQWGGVPVAEPWEAVAAPPRAVPLACLRPAAAAAAVFGYRLPREPWQPVGLRADALARMPRADAAALAALLTEAEAERRTDGRRRDAADARRLAGAYREAVAEADAAALAVEYGSAAVRGSRTYRPVGERQPLRRTTEAEEREAAAPAARVCLPDAAVRHEAARAALAAADRFPAPAEAAEPFGPLTAWAAAAASRTEAGRQAAAWLAWADASRAETGGGAVRRSGRRRERLAAGSPAAAVALQSRRHAAALAAAWERVGSR